MKRQVITFLVLFAVSVVFTVKQIRSTIMSNYTYERDYGQLWELGVKSSTIQAKAQYIDDFYNALLKGRDQGKFAEYNAVFLKNQNNGFVENLSALYTLDERLRQIKEMNPNTFEYNTAIQQITAQEQGEAQGMLMVFQGCYDLANYSCVWDWYRGLWIFGIVVLWIFTLVAFAKVLDL